MEVDKLSKLVDIRYFSRSDGDIVVFTEAGHTLVDTVPTHHSRPSFVRIGYFNSL